MRFSRLLLLTVVVLALVGLVTLWAGTEVPTAAEVDRPPLPVSRTEGGISSSWYCASGVPAAGGSGATNHVLLTNPTDSPVTARLTAFGADGPKAPVSVEVGARDPLAVNVATTLGAATVAVAVETSSAELAVEHQIATSTGADQVPCSTFSSGRWYFPAATTTTNASAQLTLFNPFPGDASVDISVAVDTGVRVPTGLNGVVIPAGTVKVIDLGQTVQRRDQFSATVVLRSGRAVAELLQTFDGAANPDGSPGPRGLRLQLGVPEARATWVMAAGFTGTGAAETVLVYNPSPRQLQVSIQVTPFGSPQLPEPIKLEVPSLRSAAVNLSAETRVPPEGYHSITVQSDDGSPIVAVRLNVVTAAPSAPTDPAIPTRPPVTKGTAMSTGTSAAAANWIIPWTTFGSSYAPAVLVHNPGTDDASVTVSAIVGGSLTPMADSSQIAVPKGQSVVFQGAAFTSLNGPAGLTVAATNPVVVEQLSTWPTQNDFSMGVAIPVLGERTGLIPIGQQ